VGCDPGFSDQAADAVVATLPNGERRVVEGQSHVADPLAFAVVLARIFTP
jgi:hypothetical protein